MPVPPYPFPLLVALPLPTVEPGAIELVPKVLFPTTALEGSDEGVGAGVEWESGVAEGSEVAGLYEKGGYVGKVDDDGRSDTVEEDGGRAESESSGTEDTDEDDSEEVNTTVVVVLNVVPGCVMAADEEVAGGGATVVVVVVSVVDWPGLGTDAEEEGGEAVRNDKLVVSDLWVMIIDPTDEGTETVTEPVDRGTGITTVAKDDEEVEMRLELAAGRNTVTVVVDRVGVVIAPVADEEVAEAAITVVVVVLVTVVDDAEAKSDAELEDTGTGTTTLSEGEDALPDVEIELTSALEGGAERFATLEDDADRTSDDALGTGTGTTTVTVS
jgi:hypothetical protein